MSRQTVYAAIVLLALVLIALAMAPTAATANGGGAGVPCEAINSAGVITVYWCEPEYGPPYIINSVGFMLWVD